MPLLLFPPLLHGAIQMSLLFPIGLFHFNLVRFWLSPLCSGVNFSESNQEIKIFYFIFRYFSSYSPLCDCYPKPKRGHSQQCNGIRHHAIQIIVSLYSSYIKENKCNCRCLMELSGTHCWRVLKYRLIKN